MNRIQRTRALVAAAGLAISATLGSIAHGQVLFTTFEDFSAWPLPDSIVESFILSTNPSSVYNGLGSGGASGPGAPGTQTAIDLESSNGEANSQNFISNVDADYALAGADLIQADIYGTGSSAPGIDLYLSYGNGGYQTFDIISSPYPPTYNGSYWTVTYPDSFIYTNNTSPGSQTYLELGFYSDPQQPTFLTNIRVVPPGWNNPAGGDWNTYGNWTTSDSLVSPNHQGLEADFLGGITSNATVTTSQTVNIGTILLSNATASYTLAASGAGNIIMNMPGVEPAAINDQGGTHFISAPVQLASNTNITVANAADVLHISGPISGTGGLTLNGNGSLSLESANSYGPSTTVSSGTLIANVNGALPNGTNLINNGTTQVNGNQTLASLSGTGTVSIGNNVIVVDPTVHLAANSGLATQGGLTIAAGSALDLVNNKLIINYGSGPDPASTIRGYLINGYDNGAWDGLRGTSPGGGIISVSANPQFGIGYADGADGVVHGLSSGQIEIAYTLYGDANMDGVVSGDDFTIMAGNLGKSVTGWDQGDFNYDGVVGGNDFTLLIGNLGKQANGGDVVLPASDYAAIDAFAAANGLMADVPEPASASILAILGFGMLRRRKKILWASLNQGRAAAKCKLA